ncbi:MAG: class I SAM-dependent methyltransferase [Candidatus Micrarchaeota archaeon]|nr:class I SAM-dependent methyltransferase [Candidatus Micrarchaeota archaeon]
MRGQITDDVTSFYSNYPYPSIRFPFGKRHRQFVGKLISLWGFSPESIRGKEVLDAGCGTGEKALLLAHMGAQVTAVDICQKQVERAYGLAKMHNQDIHFAVADVTRLSLNRKFDGILCSGVLHHTADPHGAFRRLCAHLKPGGRIIVGLYNAYSRVHYRVVRAALRTAFRGDPGRIMSFIAHNPFAAPLRTASLPTLYDRYAVPHESYHTLGEVRKMFAENGIEVHAISPEVCGPDTITQLCWLLQGKSFFFVSGVKLS